MYRLPNRHAVLYARMLCAVSKNNSIGFSSINNGIISSRD